MPVKSILFGFIVLIGLLMFYAGFVVVNPGHVGVKKSLGKVREFVFSYTYDLHMKLISLNSL